MGIKYENLKSNKGEFLEGILLIKPKIFKDSRGFFMESWNSKEFNKVTKNEIEFVQDNHSFSFKGVLRGLHYQFSPYPQGKLVRCLNGKIFDVAVDIRKKSKTFGQWIGVTLDADKHYQLWIPEGFAHGFLTLSNEANVAYKTTQYWMKDYEATIKWDDPYISIDWPNINMQPILSDKDKNSDYINLIDSYKLL